MSFQRGGGLYRRIIFCMFYIAVYDKFRAELPAFSLALLLSLTTWLLLFSSDGDRSCLMLVALLKRGCIHALVVFYYIYALTG
jgi:hypothetical protein